MAVFPTRSKPISIKLGDAYEALKRDFEMLVKSSLVVVFNYTGDVEVSLFSGGRMLMKNVKDEKAALNIYSRIMEKLGVRI